MGRVKRVTQGLLRQGEVVAGSSADRELSGVIAEALERLGLSVERHEFTTACWLEEEVELIVEGERLKAVALPNSPSGYVEGELVHAGEGESLKLSGLEGKLALIGMTPEDPDYVVAQYTLALRAGASAVVFYDYSPHTLRRIVLYVVLSYAKGPSLPPPIPAVAVRREDALKLIKGRRRYAQLSVKTRYSESAKSCNLIAYSEGEPRVLLTAHYDRWLGGVGDNTVGVALLLQLAEKLRGVRDLGFVVFGAEEYGAPHYTPWYWSWGSRNYVERLKASSELEELLAVINLDVPVRSPLTVSASGPEYRESARRLLGEEGEYELDSPYFDSYSFSSAGVAALTLHSLWRYMDYYHSDRDTLDAVDWRAVALAGEWAAKLAREVAERRQRFFRYEAWRAELLTAIARASRFLEPPASLLKVVKSLEPDERTARKLRARLIRLVADGGLLEPGVFKSVVAPQLLIAEDLELLEKALNGELEPLKLRELRLRWVPGEDGTLPSIDLEPVASYLERADSESAARYLREVKRVSIAWLEVAYRELLEELVEVLGEA
ncbi:MAG: M28 family peptidase [Thermoproteales archaeon]|nr:M28 family peptidase [Thermoproteales archaeon]